MARHIAAVIGEGGVHHQHMADELEIRVIVGGVVENDERVVEGDSEDQQYFRYAEDHGFPLFASSPKV